MFALNKLFHQKNQYLVPCFVSIIQLEGGIPSSSLGTKFPVKLTDQTPESFLRIFSVRLNTPYLRSEHEFA